MAMGVSFLKWFFSVRKCGGCGEILGPDRYYEPFCSNCDLAWRASLTASCGNCFLPALECRCMPKQLERAGALCLRKLFFYESENARSPQMSLIFSLKRRRITRMIDFAAENVAKLVLSELEELGFFAEPEKFIVSFVPRGRRVIIEYGFDHAALVSEGIAKKLGLQFAPLLRSGLGAKAQKELGKKQRLENAEKNIRFCADIDISGKYVILFDDIVTSGASMTVCTKKLMKNGAVGVFCFSLASKK